MENARAEWLRSERLALVERCLEDLPPTERTLLLSYYMHDGRSRIHTLRFPPQQYKLGQDDAAFDGATGKAAGTIVALDESAGELKLRRGPKLKDVALPRTLIPSGPYETPAQQAALLRFATSLLADDGRYRALRDILIERHVPLVRDDGKAL